VLRAFDETLNYRLRRLNLRVQFREFKKFILSSNAVHNSAIDSTTMGRIVIPGGGDLSTSFRTALNSLAEAGILLRPGTKLLTRYAVVVVDQAALDAALTELLKAGIKVQTEA